MTISKKIVIALITTILIFVVIKVFFFDIVKFKEENTGQSKRVLILKTKNFHEDDLVLFEKPFSGKYIVSRIVAQSNDTVLIKNGKLFVNNKPKEFSNTSYLYRINAFSEESFYLLKNKYHFVETENILGVYFLNLKQRDVDLLAKDSMFLIKREVVEKGIGNKEIFPQSFKYRWNEDNFGPLIIMKKGDLIELNEDNYSLYKNTLKYFESTEMSIKSKIILINGLKAKEYKFANNYVFLLNDKRNDYNDSRSLGMVSVKNIRGKIIKIIK